MPTLQQPSILFMPPQMTGLINNNILIIIDKITESISLSLASFFSIVFCADSFLLSYSRVPEASSIIDRIYSTQTLRI